MKCPGAKKIFKEMLLIKCEKYSSQTSNELLHFMFSAHKGIAEVCQRQYCMSHNPRAHRTTSVVRSVGLVALLRSAASRHFSQ